MNKIEKQTYEDTSFKKYPYSKYFEHKDEDVHLVRTLQYEDEVKNSVPMYDEEDNSEDKQNYYIRANKPQKHKKQLKNQNQNYLSVDFISNSQKQSKVKKKTGISSSSKSKKSTGKFISKQNPKKRNRKTDREKVSNSLLNCSDVQKDDSHYYKKLCLDMRKKNHYLTQQLKTCKETNRKSIAQLQKKVSRISEGKKQQIDSDRIEKIYESLRNINGKIKKNSNHSEGDKYKKFYQFFVQSIDILEPTGKFTQKVNIMELQLLWKQIIQFLITHDFKIEEALRGHYQKRQ